MDIKDLFKDKYVIKDALKISPNTKYDFKGKTVVFTGKLKSMERTVAANHVKSNGGYVATSMSRNTSYVVTPDDFNEDTNKLNKAKSYGTIVITETQFKASLGI